MYKIILIDDEKLVLESLERRIQWETCGFEVIAKATNGLEGLELIRRLKPDIVFTDIRMPVMSGLDLIKTAFDELLPVKFVVISGHSEFEYAKKAIDYDALGFCLKPFEEDEIYGILNKAKTILMQKNDINHDQPQYAVINFQGSISKKAEALDRLLIKDGSCKWIFALHGEPDAKYLDKKQCYPIPSDQFYKMYLIVSDDGDAIAQKASGDIMCGISNPFYHAMDIDTALEEARIASFQYFINRKNFNCYIAASDVTDIAGLLKDLKVAYKSEDMHSINALFGRFQKAADNNSITMTEAFRIYNTVVTLLNDAGLEFFDRFINLVASYSDFSSMLNALADNIKKNIIKISEDSSRSDVMQKILYYINENYNDPLLSVNKVSSVFGFNPNYTSQFFKKSESQNFSAYLTQLRMKHAQHLLKNTNLQVGEIGEKVGYLDYFYFAKVFKKYVKLTPGDYRIKCSE